MGFNRVVYVYPDIAFAVSLLMNTLILWGTARVYRLPAGKGRIMAGAVIGALYSMAAAFPALGVLHSFWLKMACSVVMFAAAFAPLKLKRFTAGLMVFYITSVALGGAFLGLLYFVQTGPFYVAVTDISGLVARYFWPVLVVTAVGYIMMTRFAGGLLQKKLTQNLFRVPLKVLFDDAQIEVIALIDTGNHLVDPLSGIPVIVVEYGALVGVFPSQVRTAFETGPDLDLALVLDALAATSWANRFRVIPFTSLGKDNGLLIGFRPDLIEIRSSGQTVLVKKVIVAVYRRELSPEGGYRALLHPDVLNSLTA